VNAFGSGGAEGDADGEGAPDDDGVPDGEDAAGALTADVAGAG